MTQIYDIIRNSLGVTSSWRQCVSTRQLIFYLVYRFSFYSSLFFSLSYFPTVPHLSQISVPEKSAVQDFISKFCGMYNNDVGGFWSYCWLLWKVEKVYICQFVWNCCLKKLETLCYITVKTVCCLVESSLVVVLSISV